MPDYMVITLCYARLNKLTIFFQIMKYVYYSQITHNNQQ